MKADESPMALNELQKLLSDIQEAIKDDDYEKLLASIKVVANDITDITSSDDAFLKISNFKSTDTF
jgi:predicted house-cleaning noncanonical NTP pyrophosphatase (MazG superfamily)